MKKKIIPIIFLSSLETITFTLLHDFFFNELFPSRGIGMLNWGISLEIAFIEFIIFALILNAFLVIYTRVKPIWPITAATVLYSVTWLTDLPDTPILVLKLIAAECIGFLSYYLFARILKVVTKKSVQPSNPN